MSKRYFLVAFVIFLGSALSLFYLPWLTGKQSFYLFDISAYYEPTLRLIAEGIRQHSFLLWNPYSYCGMPQIAISEPGLFYPPNWIFALLSFNSAFALNLLLHQLLAGIGNFLLVASFGWGFVPSCLAGIAAALCSYMFSTQTNYTLMATAAWCPIILWFLYRIGKGSVMADSCSTLFAGICTTMMILAGRPEIFAPALLCYGLYVLVSVIQGHYNKEDWRSLLKTAFLRLSALFLGILISCPAILPVMEWLPLSPRDTNLVPEDILYWSASWYDFLCLLLPQPLGDLYLRPAKFAVLVSAKPAIGTYLASAFVGPIIFALAFLGMGDRSWKAKLALLLLLVFSLVLAAGHNTPVDEFLLYKIPGLHLLRYPIKLLYFPSWVLILFACRGIYLVIQNRIPNIQWVINASIWFSVAAMGGIVTCLPQPLLSVCVNRQIFTRNYISPNMLLEAQQLIGIACAQMAALALLTLLLCWLKQKGQLKTATFSLLILSLVYGTLMAHAFAFSYHAASSDYFDKPSYLQMKLPELKKDLAKLENISRVRVAALYFGGLLQPNEQASITAADRSIAHQQFNRQMFDTSQHCEQHYGSSFGYMLSETTDYRSLFIDVFNHSHLSSKKIFSVADGFGKNDLPFYRFCQMTSTKYVLGPIDKFVYANIRRSSLLDPKMFDLLIEDPSWNVRVYEVKSALPRVYISYRWQFVGSHDRALQIIKDSARSNFNPQACTLLEIDKPDGQSNCDSLSKEHTGFAKLIENSANEVEVEVATDRPAYLVLTDHYYPGWLAYLDNQQQIPIVRANAVLRAVAVPPGKHFVEFRYEPQSLKIAFLISLASFLALLVISIVSYFVGRQRQARKA